MNRAFNILMSLCVLSASMAFGALPEIPEDDAGASLWKSKRKRTIESLLPQENEVKIPQLGEMLRQLERLNYRNRPEKDEIIKLLQQSLVLIPGHAEYYGDRILDAYQELRRAMAAGVNASSEMAVYQRERRTGFATLSHFPSPETVRVLGDMLFDEWQNPIPFQGEMREAPISHYALRALSSLPLVNKPSQPEDHELPGALRTWQLWYEQVRAGNRTFRFEGDPAEYTLEGRATAALSPSVGSRARASGAAPQPDEAENEDASPVLVAVLAAAALLFSGALAYSVSSRRQRA